MQTRHIQHGRRRPWYRPWQVICRCGLDAWPCPVIKMREAQARPLAAAPSWSQPTVRLPFVRSAPLLTRGQSTRAGDR